MLTHEQQLLWDAYLQVEARGTREDKILALNAFLDVLETSPRELWSQWALEIAERYADKGEGFPLRMPLFQRAVFPALLDAYHRKQSGSARWLAGLVEHLHNSQGLESLLQLAEMERTDVGLWLVALQHDPSDVVSRQRLLEEWSKQLQIAIHEVPCGLVYDVDGPTINQCTEMQTWLADFTRQAELANQREYYSDLIETCHRHFHAYQDYLRNREAYRDYPDYLKQHPAT